jgi:hypothetical protein
MTTQSAIERHLSHDIRHAERTLMTSGSLIPMMVVHADNGIHVFAMPWTDQASKVKIIQLVRIFCLANDATALSMIVEAWMATVPIVGEASEAARRALRGIPPSQRPDREEVVLATYATWIGGQQKTFKRMHPIIRNAAGAVTGLGLNATDFGPDNEMTGLLTNILPPPNAPAREREVARKALTGLPGGLFRKIELDS